MLQLNALVVFSKRVASADLDIRRQLLGLFEPFRLVP
jgi:hypothetical protein